MSGKLPETVMVAVNFYGGRCAQQEPFSSRMNALKDVESAILAYGDERAREEREAIAEWIEGHMGRRDVAAAIRARGER